MNDNKSPQNRYCCVPLCNQKGSTGPNGEKVGFFRIPDDKYLRAQWLHAIRRDTGKHFSITDSTKVCSLHFKSEHLKKSLGIGRLTYVAGAVPSVFAWRRSSPRKRPPPRPREDPVPKNITGSKVRTSLNMSAVSISESPVTNIASDSKVDFCALESDSTSVATEHESCIPENRINEVKQISILEEMNTRNKKLEAELEEVRTHARKLSEKCSKLESRIFSIDNFTSDEDIAFYTRFPSYAVFMATYTYLDPGETGENIRFWRSVQSDVDPEYYQREPDLGVGRGRPRTLNSKEEFFLVMCRLRQGFPERHLGYLFNISQSTVSRIVISWVNFMYLKLGQLNIWPSRKVVDDTMPPDFLRKYPNTRAIIDCTEIKCQMPSSLLLNSELFSTYKNHTTLKTLIAISPAGHISFISQLYTGSISDREITERSGFLDLPFDPNDSVMADKGFTIQDLLPVGVSLNIPPFLGSSAQMPAEDVVRTQEIASLRIHVERAINKIKNFHIWDGVLPLSLFGIVNQMWTVCIYICNVQDPIIS